MINSEFSDVKPFCFDNWFCSYFHLPSRSEKRDSMQQHKLNDRPQNHTVCFVRCENCVKVVTIGKKLGSSIPAVMIGSKTATGIRNAMRQIPPPLNIKFDNYCRIVTRQPADQLVPTMDCGDHTRHRVLPIMNVSHLPVRSSLFWCHGNSISFD